MRFLNDLPATHLQDLSYSDVFLVPNFSDVVSRFDVDLSTFDGTGTTVPLVSANMTAVTGRRMVETMSRRGGLGVLPQDIPIDVVADVTAWVKSKHVVIETVLTLQSSDTVISALHIMNKRAHGAVVVVDDNNVCLGIVKQSDCKEVDKYASLASVMRTNPVSFEIGEIALLNGSFEKTLHEIYKNLDAQRLSFVPVTKAGKLVGALTRRGVLRSVIYKPNLDKNGSLAVGAAIGINGDVAGKAAALLAAGVDTLVVDTAHGHQQKMFDALKIIRSLHPNIPIVAGNVVSAAGVQDLVAAGANILKVGVGPGAMCTTRMMTAVGRPQFSAVYDCAKIAKDLGAHVWADGGVRHPRDVALALAAGASQVMVGSWFSGTYESPGDLLLDSEGRFYKESFGMASARAVSARNADSDVFDRAKKALFEEGISTSKMYLDDKRPSVEDLLDLIVAGVRSSMTYTGARDLQEFFEKAVVGLQSSAGYDEGRALPTGW